MAFIIQKRIESRLTVCIFSIQVIIFDWIKMSKSRQPKLTQFLKQRRSQSTHSVKKLQDPKGQKLNAGSTAVLENQILNQNDPPIVFQSPSKRKTSPENIFTLGVSPRKTPCKNISPASSTKIKSPKYSPGDVKKILGTPNTAQKLQERFKLLKQSPTPITQSARKALFIDDKCINDEVCKSTQPATPKLSKGGLEVKYEVNIPKLIKIPPSPVKASPRKQAVHAAEAVVDKVKLLQPSKELNLPQTYKELAEIFCQIDNILLLKMKYSPRLSLDELKKHVKTVTDGKSLTENHLKQILCVYPKSYNFSWLRKGKEYELLIELNTEDSYQKSFNVKDLVQRLKYQEGRLKYFEHLLLTIVQDHHQEFLNNQNIDMKNEEIHRWHKNFDLDSCSAIDILDFPPKPIESTPIRNPKEMLNQIRGVNTSVEKALEKVVEITTPIKHEPMNTPIKANIKNDININPQLLSLSPLVLAKLKKKEAEKQVREMGRSAEQEKKIIKIEELLHERVRSSLSLQKWH